MQMVEEAFSLLVIDSIMALFRVEFSVRIYDCVCMSLFVCVCGMCTSFVCVWVSYVCICVYVCMYVCAYMLLECVF